jgi:hypothetical protein
LSGEPGSMLGNANRFYSYSNTFLFIMGAIFKIIFYSTAYQSFVPMNIFSPNLVLF